MDRMPARRYRVSGAHDALERAADGAADTVLRGGRATLSRGGSGVAQRKCAACEEEDMVLRRADGAGPVVTSGSVGRRIDAARTGGQPLPAALRRRFEPGFSFDFRRVRVHADGESDALAAALRARAFTIGNDLFFRSGHYRPHQEGGQRLLAHELAHVVQQGGGAASASAGSIPVAPAGDASEREADEMATATLRGDASPASRAQSSTPRVARQPALEGEAETRTEPPAEGTVSARIASGDLAQATPAQVEEAQGRGGMVVHSSARTPDEEPLIRQARPVPSNTVECVKKWTSCRAPYSPGSWGLRISYHCPILILPFGIIVPGETRQAYVTVPDEFIGPDPSGRDMYRCRPGSIVRLRADIADAFAFALTRSTLYPSFDACHAGFRAFLYAALEAIFTPSGGGRPAGIRVNAPPPPATHPCP